jgi:hypothetical protein
MSDQSTMTPAAKAKQTQMHNAWGTGLFEATKWGLAAGIPATLASFYANKHSTFYRTRFSPSAKVATPLMVGMLFFTMRFEKVSFLLANDSRQWGYSKTGAPAEKISKLAIHEKAMNYLYDHPFGFIALTGLPMAGGILRHQLQLKHLKFQQRIMASRVFAQFGVLSILLLTMGFRGYMDGRGRFVEPSDGTEEQEEQE